jgi:hypothetical protein
LQQYKSYGTHELDRGPFFLPDQVEHCEQQVKILYFSMFLILVLFSLCIFDLCLFWAKKIQHSIIKNFDIQSQHRVGLQIIIIIIISIININHKLSKCISWLKLLRGDTTRQTITHIRECSDDLNQCTSNRRKLDNTIYVRPQTGYVWQPFTKLPQGRICSTTIRMKS